MKLSLADVKDHVLAFVHKEQLAVDAAEHKLVQRFVDYIERKQGEADAAAYLKSLGYTITPPTPATVPQ